MRHLWRAALVFAVATSSAALAGHGSKQASSADAQTVYEKLPDGYRQTVTKTAPDGTQIKVSVEQKNWRQWSQARDKELSELRAQVSQQKLGSIGEVKQGEKGMTLSLSGGVLFEFGKDELMPDAQKRLDTLAEVLQQAPDAKFTIEGHTDSKGSEEYNKDLSQRRADAVKDYLASKGVDSNNIEAIGEGESQPVATNDTPEGRANNRRVEVVIPEGTLGIGGAGKAGQEACPPQEAKPGEDLRMKHQ